MTENPLIRGVIALNPLARGAELRRLLLDAWPAQPFGPDYNAYAREVDQAVADRDVVGDDERLVFGAKPRRVR